MNCCSELIVSMRTVIFTAISCTSRPCVWNRGSLKHDPSIVTDRQYASFKMDIRRRATFDPRLQSFQSGYPTRQEINDFLCALSCKEVPCMFQTHLAIIYQDFTYSSEDLEIIQVFRTQFYTALGELMSTHLPSPGYEGPFELKDTRGQSTNDIWHFVRSICCPASVCRRIAHMRDQHSYIDFLRSHLWKLNRVVTKGMKYGLDNEDRARQAYLAKKQVEYSSVKVRVPGFYMHTEIPGQGCSSDGIVTSEKEEPKCVEIKCPRQYRKKDPNKFDEDVSQKKLNSQCCCLRREANGSISLKTNHPYYDQVQMQMGILGFSNCDFFVWSPVASVCISVDFNLSRWEFLKDKLLQFHWEVLVLEYFTMRTPRRLTPICLP